MKKIILSAINSKHTHACLSLATLKAYLEKNTSDLTASIFEFDLNQNIDSIFAELVRIKPDFLAFSTYIWSFETIIEISGAIKSAFPQMKICLGGPEVTFQAESILQRFPWIDFIIRGEGEETFTELLLSNFELDDLLKIDGLSFQNNSKIYSNNDRKLIENLDVIPSPFELGIYKNGKGYTYYEASRGCPSKCSYCLSSVLGKLRNFSINRVKKDLDWFFNSDYEQIRFSDRTFNFDKNRAKEILNYILQNNVQKKNFHFEIQADILDEEIVELLASEPHGIFHLEIGIQSLNLKALAAVNRACNPQKLEKMIIFLRDHTRCHLHLDLLGGLPEDTYLQFRDSFNKVWNFKPNCIQVSLIKVLRGTPFENEVKTNRVSCMPTPPYTLTRTLWMSPEELIRIQEIGKLVESIRNSERFTISLHYITENLYQNNAIQFFEDLLDYWLKMSFLNFGMNPRTIKERLVSFLIHKFPEHPKTKELETLFDHELQMSLRSPSTEFSSSPDFPDSKMKDYPFKVLPSLKVIWQKHNIESLISNQDKNIKGNYFPTLYFFEKNPALKNKTVHLELPLIEKFTISSVLKKLSTDQMARMCLQLYDWEILPDHFEKVLENLCQRGLIYNLNVKSFDEIKDYIPEEIQTQR